jgi:hypothetical protein
MGFKVKLIFLLIVKFVLSRQIRGDRRLVFLIM